ncbi:uncharacterized protein LOC135479411 [Liolophura sinensis]|uniref:uncharacterized protein LOC135479411 n=1 Tax=Liolophura sinensis TaxID=3198878 RepID=UPI0031598CFC
MDKVLLLLCLGGIYPLILGEQLDILAFDFYRKFGHYVHLGECADVSRPSASGKSTKTANCHLKKDGTESFQASEIVHESVVEVKSPIDLFSHLGLCDGNSVSRLGLLYNSECVTVDIAKSIAFDDATYNRALFGTYRRGMVLLGSSSVQNGGASGQEGEPNFYPKYITYGSKEMILVSLTYKTEADAKSSKKIEFSTDKLSDQLETLLQFSSHNLETIKIIRLSTADREYRSWNFPQALAAGSVERVKSEQSEMEEVRQRVLSKLAMDPYYMNYVMWPFTGDAPAAMDRASKKTMLWKNVTLCEIQLNHVMRIGEKVKEAKCVGTMLSSKYCRRLSRRMARLERTIAKNVHTSRAAWYQMSTEEKTNLTEKCQKMCVINEHKMDRAVNKVLFGMGADPVIGRSRSIQGQWRRKWSRRKNRKLRGKKKDGRRHKRIDRNQKRRKQRRQQRRKVKE